MNFADKFPYKKTPFHPIVFLDGFIPKGIVAQASWCSTILFNLMCPFVHDSDPYFSQYIPNLHHNWWVQWFFSGNEERGDPNPCDPKRYGDTTHIFMFRSLTNALIWMHPKPGGGLFCDTLFGGTLFGGVTSNQTFFRKEPFPGLEQRGRGSSSRKVSEKRKTAPQTGFARWHQPVDVHGGSSWWRLLSLRGGRRMKNTTRSHWGGKHFS